MRRNPWAPIAIAVGLVAGCGQSVPYRNVVPGQIDPAVVPAVGEGADPSVPRFAREAVPDSVMLRDQLNAGYQDRPGAPY